MSLQVIIDIGSGYNTNDGDKLRDGGQKINGNFTDLWPRGVAWRSGNYYDYCQVLYQDITYILASDVVLPFNSVNFPNEVANGTWIQTSNEKVIPDNSFAVFKGEGNTDPSVLEIGDSVRGFSPDTANIFWDMAIYNGGLVGASSSYTIYNYFELI